MIIDFQGTMLEGGFVLLPDWISPEDPGQGPGSGPPVVRETIIITGSSTTAKSITGTVDD